MKARIRNFLYMLTLAAIGLSACGMMVFIIARGSGGFTESSFAEEPDNEPLEICGSPTTQMPSVLESDFNSCLSPRQIRYLQSQHPEPPMPILSPAATRAQAAQYELELAHWRSQVSQ